jgi:hypothetical protein
MQPVSADSKSKGNNFLKTGNLRERKFLKKIEVLWELGFRKEFETNHSSIARTKETF